MSCGPPASVRRPAAAAGGRGRAPSRSVTAEPPTTPCADTPPPSDPTPATGRAGSRPGAIAPTSSAAPPAVALAVAVPGRPQLDVGVPAGPTDALPPEP